jgi:hemerythrin-like domain-containing protein
VVVGIFDYFKDYPDSCHHPKEDMIFDKLKSRNPAAAAKIGDLRIEHVEEASRLRRSAQAVERVLADQDLLRETVDKIIRDFIVHERQHMKMEEQIFFPTALKALQPKDWADIALKLADRRDPLDGPDLEQKFSMLRRKILETAAEAEAERLT